MNSALEYFVQVTQIFGCIFMTTILICYIYFIKWTRVIDKNIIHFLICFCVVFYISAFEKAFKMFNWVLPWEYLHLTAFYLTVVSITVICFDFWYTGVTQIYSKAPEETYRFSIYVSFMWLVTSALMTFNCWCNRALGELSDTLFNPYSITFNAVCISLTTFFALAIGLTFGILASYNHRRKRTMKIDKPRLIISIRLLLLVSLLMIFHLVRLCTKYVFFDIGYFIISIRLLYIFAINFRLYEVIKRRYLRSDDIELSDMNKSVLEKRLLSDTKDK